MRSCPMPQDPRIDNEGVWSEVLIPVMDRLPRSALFLDRDGVIIEDLGFIFHPDDVRLISGAVEVIQAANRRGHSVVIVSNQSGVGRGLFGWPEFESVQMRLLEILAHAGAVVDAVYACPHHRDGLPPYNQADHPARKPNPGMLLRAIADLRIDRAKSWIVGDRATDLVAGRSAGLAGGLHVATGYGNHSEERRAALALRQAQGFKVFCGASIGDALTMIPLVNDDKIV